MLVGIKRGASLPHTKQLLLTIWVTLPPFSKHFCVPNARACLGPQPSVLKWKCLKSLTSKTGKRSWQGQVIFPFEQSHLDLYPGPCDPTLCPQTQTFLSAFTRIPKLATSLISLKSSPKGAETNSTPSALTASIALLFIIKKETCWWPDNVWPSFVLCDSFQHICFFAKLDKRQIALGHEFTNGWEWHHIFSCVTIRGFQSIIAGPDFSKPGGFWRTDFDVYWGREIVTGKTDVNHLCSYLSTRLGQLVGVVVDVRTTRLNQIRGFVCASQPEGFLVHLLLRGFGRRCGC